MIDNLLYKAIEETSNYDKFLQVFDGLIKKKVNANIAYKIAVFLAR